MSHSLIKLLAIEDNIHFTQSLKRIIEKADNMNWLVAYPHANAVLDAIQSDQLPQADVILLDLNLPGRNGLTLIPQLKNQLPDAKILILTQDDNYLTTLEAIQLGVSGYILKTAGVEEIWDAIREVHQGGCVIDARLSGLVLKALTTDDAPADNPLSPREQQILELLALGYVKKEVANQLGLKYRSVSSYSENLFKKLQVTNVAAAVATAIRKGLI